MKAFAATRYPFIVSTKGALIGDDDYIDLIRDCKCVIQISLVCPEYDVLERGAPEFSARLKLIEKLAKYQRVIVRIQPYMPEVHHQHYEKYPFVRGGGSTRYHCRGDEICPTKDGLVKVGADYCYKVPVLKKRYEEMKEAAHDIGMNSIAAKTACVLWATALLAAGLTDWRGSMSTDAT